MWNWLKSRGKDVVKAAKWVDDKIIKSPFYQNSIKSEVRRGISALENLLPETAIGNIAKAGIEKIGSATDAYGVIEVQKTKSGKPKSKKAASKKPATKTTKKPATKTTKKPATKTTKKPATKTTKKPATKKPKKSKKPVSKKSKGGSFLPPGY